MFVVAHYNLNPGVNKAVKVGIMCPVLACYVEIKRPCTGCDPNAGAVGINRYPVSASYLCKWKFVPGVVFEAITQEAWGCFCGDPEVVVVNG